MLRHSALSVVFLGLVTLGAFGLLRVLLSGFVPAEDQGLVIASIMLPDGAWVERTDAGTAPRASWRPFRRSFPAIRKASE